MVPILVLLTFVAFIVVARVFFHGREAATEGVPAGAAREGLPLAAPGFIFFPSATYLHPGHAWVRFAPDGMATVGATDFAANFVGEIAGVETPREGRVLRQGEPGWTLVSSRNRRLTQAMPVDGEILEVNHDFAAHKRGAQPDWILKIRPARIAENLQNLVGGTLADAWQEVAGLKLNAALAPALGRIAHDGGVWMENFGDLLEDADWTALRRDLFPPQHLVPPQNGADPVVR